MPRANGVNVSRPSIHVVNDCFGGSATRLGYAQLSEARQ